jgi:hypothetical protein
MTGTSDDRMAHSLDDSELLSRTAAGQPLNEAEIRKTYKALSAREQKRWRHKISTRLWRSFKLEVALKDVAAFTVRDGCEAVTAEARLLLDREWELR